MTYLLAHLDAKSVLYPELMLGRGQSPFQSVEPIDVLLQLRQLAQIIHIANSALFTAD